MLSLEGRGEGMHFRFVEWILRVSVVGSLPPTPLFWRQTNILNALPRYSHRGGRGRRRVVEQSGGAASEEGATCSADRDAAAKVKAEGRQLTRERACRLCLEV